MNGRRNVSALATIMEWCRTRKADGEFHGKTRGDFRRWRGPFAHNYRRSLGPWPERVPPRLKVTGRKDMGDYVRERIIYDSSPGVTVPAFLLTPKGICPGERRPALLAAHGHGAGKADICGLAFEGKDKTWIKWVRHVNYDYAVQAVRRGYVVIAPDWIPFGERKPPASWIWKTRDACDPAGLAWGYWLPLLTQNVWDAMRAVDVLAGCPYVDPRRIGVIGISYGGTMATHILINDPRVRAGVVSGYLSTVRYDALNMRGRGNTCGAQHVPGLLRYGDIPDMMGLMAPKPVLFECGKRETCFHFPDMMRAWKRVRAIYTAAGARDRAAVDIHGYWHRWKGGKAWDWLGKWLL